MNSEDILVDKKLLVVDDEPDILETLEELLYKCDVDTASSFEEAITLLKENQYDAAVLDIMGVKGYDILEATSELNIPTIMLTAHAFSPDNLKKSIELGADAYVPKDKLVDITTFVADVLGTRKAGKKINVKWFSLLKPFFDRFFGSQWRDEERDFWDEFDLKHFESRDDIRKME